MKKILYIFALFLTTVPFTILPTFASNRGMEFVTKNGQSLYLYKDYKAIVIGVSDYHYWPKLPNAVKDAKEVAAKLKELEFDVILLLDPSYKDMKKVFNELTYGMGKEENRAILLYFAGHGETEVLADKSNMGYIIPRDCPILKEDPMGFSDHAFSMMDIESYSYRIKSKHVLMLFDSCFSGSLFNLARAMPSDISEKSAMPVRQYITAGSEDEQVPDKSMFKRCFLKGLDGDGDLTKDGYITGTEMGMYLSDSVINYTKSAQHPQYGKIRNPDLDRGDFIFPSLDEIRCMEKLEKERIKTAKLLNETRKLHKSLLNEQEKKEEILKEKSQLEKRIESLTARYQELEENTDLESIEILANLGYAKDKFQKEAAKANKLKKEVKNKKDKLKEEIAEKNELKREIEILQDKIKTFQANNKPEIHEEESKTSKDTDKKKKYNMAIFPFEIGHSQYLSAGLKEKLVDTIFQLTNQYKDILITHSYYKYDGIYQEQHIEYINDTINKKLKNDLWHRVKVFSPKTPNIKAIKRLAETIGADLVLTYLIKIEDPGGDNMLFDVDVNTYLIDVGNSSFCKENKVCTTKVNLDSFACFESMTNKLFASYLDKNLRTVDK